MQEIIVYMVIAVAAGGAIYYLCRKLKALKRNTDCAGCSECPLKQNCTKRIEERNTSGCCCSLKEKSPET